MLNIAAHLMACRRRRVAAGVVDPPMGVRLCPGDGQPCHLHAREGTCGVAGAVVAVEVGVRAKPAEKTGEGEVAGMKRLGPILWRRLHTATDADPAWLDKFASTVPCGECKKHWSAALAAIPPVFGAGWFAWTVAAHNAVNAAIGKPPMELAAARALYFPPRGE